MNAGRGLDDQVDQRAGRQQDGGDEVSDGCHGIHLLTLVVGGTEVTSPAWTMPALLSFHEALMDNRFESSS
jgi:hypothetical protein